MAPDVEAVCTTSTHDYAALTERVHSIRARLHDGPLSSPDRMAMASDLVDVTRALRDAAPGSGPVKAKRWDPPSWQDVCWETVDGKELRNLPDGSIVVNTEAGVSVDPWGDDFGQYPWNAPLWRGPDGLWRSTDGGEVADGSSWFGGSFVVLLRGPGTPDPCHMGRVIDSLAGLDRLPAETVVRLSSGNVAKRGETDWKVVGSADVAEPDAHLWLPARVLDLPARSS